jgi:protein TonB
MPTPPPPPEPALNSLPSPPPIADLPVAPTPPQHVATHPKRTTVKVTQAPVASEAPTNQVTDAGPSDYLNAPEPDYPYSARQRHEVGTVLLRVVVSEEGNPTAVTIERSSGYGILDQSALTTVRDEYRFKVGNSRILLVPISFRPR